MKQPRSTFLLVKDWKQISQEEQPNAAKVHPHSDGSQQPLEQKQKSCWVTMQVCVKQPARAHIQQQAFRALLMWAALLLGLWPLCCISPLSSRSIISISLEFMVQGRGVLVMDLLPHCCPQRDWAGVCCTCRAAGSSGRVQQLL